MTLFKNETLVLKKKTSQDMTKKNCSGERERERVCVCVRERERDFFEIAVRDIHFHWESGLNLSRLFVRWLCL